MMWSRHLSAPTHFPSDDMANRIEQKQLLAEPQARLRLCKTVFLTRRISLEIYAIQSSFRVFPFVFFTRSVIEPAPQNSITSCKTNISVQRTLNTDLSCIAKQNNQITALIWEAFVKQRMYFTSLPGKWIQPNVFNVCQTYMEYVSH